MSTPTTAGPTTRRGQADEQPARPQRRAPHPLQDTSRAASQWSPSTALPSGADAGLPAGPAGERAGRRLRAVLSGTIGELRFVSERPLSLLEHLAYARRGEWTDELTGLQRDLALIYAWAIAIPISTVAYLAAWAAARPGRFASVVAVWLLVATAAARLPVVGWLVPGWMTL